MVTVCTYGRPDGLSRLLTSLRTEVGEWVDVLVVDNNPPGTDVLADVRAAFKWVTFVAEPEPGIPAARNRALEHIDGYWAVIFVDDDEYVAPGWLVAHVQYAKQSDAAVFFGPVISEYEPGSDSRVVRGQILDRARHKTGTELPYGPTNNTLVKVSALTSGSRFDPRFTMSGGSDVHFFARLRQEGHKLAWNDAALVHESIPASRASVAWVQRRYERMGHNLVSLNRDQDRRRLRLGALARIAMGGASMPLEWLTRRKLKGATGRLWVGVGMLRALRGDEHVEYVRSEVKNVNA